MFRNCFIYEQFHEQVKNTLFYSLFMSIHRIIWVFFSFYINDFYGYNKPSIWRRQCILFTLGVVPKIPFKLTRSTQDFGRIKNETFPRVYATPILVKKPTKIIKSSEKLLFFWIFSEFVQFWLENSGPNQLDELKWIILLLLTPKPSLEAE